MSADVIAVPAAQLADQFIPTPLETRAVMRDNQLVVA
jgi:hypothetical protein